MIEQQGRVVFVSGSKAEVRLGSAAGCASCDAGKGCGAGLFGRLLKRKSVNLSLDNSVHATRGQPVLVGIPEVLFLRLVVRLYLYPLAAGLVGAAFGHYIAVWGGLSPPGTDALTLLTGLVFGMAVIKWNRTVDREFRDSEVVHLLRIIEFEKCEN